MQPLVPTLYPIVRVAHYMAKRRADRLAEGVASDTVARMEAADLRLTRRILACGQMEEVH